MTGLRLRTKFLLLFSLISLVPLVLTNVLTYVRFQRTLESDAAKVESQLAATAAARVKSFVISQVGILDTVATLNNPEFFAKPDEASKIVENVLFRNENFTDIDILDKDGKEILRQDRLVVYGPGDLKNLGDTDAFKTVKEKGLYVGPMYIQGGKALFDLGRWIVDSQGTFSGAVFARVDGKVMQQVTENISAIAGTGGRVYIVDNQGIVLAHPDISYVLGQKDLSTLPPITAITSGNTESEISKTYTNESGQYVLGSAYPVSLTAADLKLPQDFKINWYVIVEQQRSVIFAEADKVALFSIIILVLVVIVAVALAVFFARRISRPVEALYTATEEFGRGNLVYRTKIRTNDEIGDLAQNFDNMARTIAKSIKNLKAEEKIVSAERDKLSIILSGITNAVIAVDLQRKIILFNKAAESLTGLKAREVLGKPIEFAVKIFEKDRAVPVKVYCPIQSEGAAVDGIVFQKNNLKLKNSSGQERSVNLISGTIYEGISISLGCILTFQDITRELVIEKTKSDFVSIAAHQLRTPLTGIKWSLLDLFNGESGQLEPAQKELVGEAVNATKRMISLVNDLLEVSRIEEGRFGINLEKQSITPLLLLLRESFHTAVEKKGLQLKIALLASLPEVNIDKEKIGIVLNNLVDNAIKYSPDADRVLVQLTKATKFVTISVQDFGMGIPKREQEKSYDRFFRAKGKKESKIPGLGLGLFISTEIVKQHGGELWVKSTDGKGSTFYVTLPLLKQS